MRKWNKMERFGISMKTISIKLPDDLLAKIKYAAKKRGKTRSTILREAPEEFLSN